MTPSRLVPHASESVRADETARKAGDSGGGSGPEGEAASSLGRLVFAPSSSPWSYDDGRDAACSRGDHVWMDVGARGVTVEQECQFCAERRRVKMDAGEIGRDD